MRTAEGSSQRKLLPRVTMRWRLHCSDGRFICPADARDSWTLIGWRAAPSLALRLRTARRAVLGQPGQPRIDDGFFTYYDEDINVRW